MTFFAYQLCTTIVLDAIKYLFNLKFGANNKGIGGYPDNDNRETLQQAES